MSLATLSKVLLKSMKAICASDDNSVYDSMECNTNIASVVLYPVLNANCDSDKILSLLLYAVNRLFNINVKIFPRVFVKVILR